jgi:hypothetical protein
LTVAQTTTIPLPSGGNSTVTENSTTTITAGGNGTVTVSTTRTIHTIHVGSIQPTSINGLDLLALITILIVGITGRRNRRLE